MFYLAIISSNFRKSSLDELRGISGFRIAEESVTAMVIDSKERRFDEKLLRSKPTFVYNILSMSKRFAINKADYLDSIYCGIVKSIPKKGAIRIECFDVNSRAGYSAKDIEVNLGQRLERKGRVVDLENPDWLVYLVLINMRCYLGYAKYSKLEKKFVNPERHYHQFSNGSLSRAELKLMQAFDEFGIKGEGIAIDLGAAPGGWSKFLVTSGFKVIAIDNAELDVSALRDLGIRIKRARGTKDLKKYLESYDIVHVQSNARDVRLPGVSVSLIADDMNMEAEESAELLLLFSKNLARNGDAILTVKCLDRKAEEHIKKAVNVLKKKFRIKGMRVLPSNRQEITIHASKR